MRRLQRQTRAKSPASSAAALYRLIQEEMAETDRRHRAETGPGPIGARPGRHPTRRAKPAKPAKARSRRRRAPRQPDGTATRLLDYLLGP